MAEMVPDERGGRPRPVAIEGSNKTIDATAVMGAIGQQGDYSFLQGDFEKSIQVERGRFVVNEKQQTTDPKVFAGGDAVNRTADAISAIADGYRAVKGIEEMLLKNKK
jgi:glutamate synthase (NADPH/NADH) small chain